MNGLENFKVAKSMKLDSLDGDKGEDMVNDDLQALTWLPGSLWYSHFQAFFHSQVT